MFRTHSPRKNSGIAATGEPRAFFAMFVAIGSNFFFEKPISPVWNPWISCWRYRD